jgi:hypothetical protein
MSLLIRFVCSSRLSLRKNVTNVSPCRNDEYKHAVLQIRGATMSQKRRKILRKNVRNVLFVIISDMRKSKQSVITRPTGIRRTIQNTSYIQSDYR